MAPHRLALPAHRVFWWPPLLWPLLQAGLVARSEWTYRRLPQLPQAAMSDSSPPVSIIIPARNEATNLRRLLPSIAKLTYAPRETIVIDDESQDSTAAIAQLFGARVVSAGPLPPGWVGKAHACWAGALTASGAWLLFTDAGPWHAPASLDHALVYAHAQGLEAISLIAVQDWQGFWEKLLLPYAYQHSGRSTRWISRRMALGYATCSRTSSATTASKELLRNGNVQASARQ